MAPLQDELRGMKASALRGRAAAEGIDDGRIEAARDQENAKAGLVALIMEHHTHLDVGQLRSMKKSALLERAKADGVDDAAIRDARDVDDDNENNEAVIALIIAQAAAAPAAASKDKEEDPRCEGIREIQGSAVLKEGEKDRHMNANLGAKEGAEEGALPLSAQGPARQASLAFQSARMDAFAAGSYDACGPLPIVGHHSWCCAGRRRRRDGRADSTAQRRCARFGKEVRARRESFTATGGEQAAREEGEMQVHRGGCVSSRRGRHRAAHRHGQQHSGHGQPPHNQQHHHLHKLHRDMVSLHNEVRAWRRPDVGAVHRSVWLRRSVPPSPGLRAGRRRLPSDKCRHRDAGAGPGLRLNPGGQPPARRLRVGLPN